jgi:hypothetical protein
LRELPNNFHFIDLNPEAMNTHTISGYGEYASPKTHSMRELTRGSFLRIIERDKPEVLRDLHEEPFELYLKAGIPDWNLTVRNDSGGISRDIPMLWDRLEKGEFSCNLILQAPPPKQARRISHSARNNREGITISFDLSYRRKVMHKCCMKNHKGAQSMTPVSTSNSS